jgi:hypothetical protein
MEFQAGQGKRSKEKGQEVQEVLGRAIGGTLRPLGALLGIFSFILASPLASLELHQTSF